ncbi:CGNR zinc finger domain-containing protein [Herbidospora daliensis]|uniref:CGNR zinc finger domain-containing protein n=1 Tax=Herbidospora daliensis TaxID=295585 RepID=UPI0007830D2D|nr:CGNR zinc finger domain-containing protein [Herbidospora daliensis]
MQPDTLIGLGGHPALDFLNSHLVFHRETFELLGDGTAYLDWLEAEHLVDAGDRAAAETDPGLDAAARAAVGLRDTLRPVIAAWAAGTPGAPDDATLAALNGLVRVGRRWDEVVPADGGLAYRPRRAWGSPEALLAPVAEAVADLFVHGDRALVRVCDDVTCGLWFYDTTKSRRRRWCSMAICGNRAKVRRHRMAT